MATPLPSTACTFSPQQRSLPDDRDGGLARPGSIFRSGRYSGPAGGCGNRQETGYRLPGAAGELDGAE